MSQQNTKNVCCRLLGLGDMVAAGLGPALLANLHGKRTITFKQLVKSVIFALSKVMEPYAPALKELQTDIEKLPGLVELAVKKPESSLKNCGILYSRDKGRMLCATHDVDRNNVLMTEQRPIASVRVAKCTCDTHDFLLPEHIHLAIGLEKSMDSSWHAEELLNNLSGGLIQSLDERGKEKLEVSIMPRDHCWGFEQITRMCVISALVAIISSHEDASLCRDRTSRLLSILVRIPSNSHAITVVEEEQVEGGSSGTKDSGSNNVVGLATRRLGIAIFSAGSSVNHSCDPNCAVRFQMVDSFDKLAHDITLEVVTAKDKIAAGEELCISYGPVCGRHDKAYRQEALRRQYCFDCRCPACASITKRPVDPINEEAVEAAVRLATEGSELTDKARLINAKAYDIIQRNEIGVAMKFCAQSIMPIVTRVQALVNEHFSEAPPLGGQLDHQLFIDLQNVRRAMLDLAAQIHARAEKFIAAAKYLSEAIDAALASTPANDPGIARDRLKMGSLYFSGGDISRAYPAITRGLQDLEPFVHVGRDADCEEARAILQFMENRGMIPEYLAKV